jgi:hypothetical protein
MAVNAALAATFIGTKGAYSLWIGALMLLGLSLGLAVGTLRLAGVEETGPSVADMRDARNTHDARQLSEWLLDGLIHDLRMNKQLLVRKAKMFDQALVLLAIAVLIELAGTLR